MHISIKTLIVAVVGAVAFSCGLHNALSHPDLGWPLTWLSMWFGATCLGIATGDVIRAARQARTAKG